MNSILFETQKQILSLVDEAGSVSLIDASIEVLLSEVPQGVQGAKGVDGDQAQIVSDPVAYYILAKT